MPKIILKRHTARVEGGEIIFSPDVEPDVISTDERTLEEQDIPGSIVKLASEVNEFNKRIQSISLKIHKDKIFPFTIEQKHIEG